MVSNHDISFVHAGDKVELVSYGVRSPGSRADNACDHSQAVKADFKCWFNVVAVRSYIPPSNAPSPQLHIRVPSTTGHGFF
jgi:hypothetical protein